MKKAILIILFAHAALFGFAQNFTLQDSIFHKGDTLRKYIYFDFNSWRMHPKSEAFLDTVAMLMLKYDSLILQIESNTDDRGSDEYNNYHSELMARSIKDYLMFRKIPPIRLIAIGMGEKDPFIPVEEIEAMETEAEQENARALNRQTVFRIIGFKK